MEFRNLKVEPATREAFAPYGVLVGVDETVGSRTGQFYGDKVELWAPGGFVSDEQTRLSVARIHARAPEVVWMERHFKHTQTFLPLGSSAFIAVLGAPTATNQPDPDTVRAFYFDGSCGAQLHLGTWHEFPFPAGEAADVVIIIRAETQENLEVKENDEAIGADLEKRNLKARLGFGFAYER
ncbi:ureidoglycolate lyase [Sphingobium phenoxybenzoativorans]|uniref:Ureidoglycolate lyase n=1 Tax=Sphingobium phenoxybenzoativorans TaxID=1592790 RepID=A0A975KBA4_9SPHN|nr:ureidoglycolate lyase [Sphingobium phenoxybenzoativorans]QUT06802.1 ureidoglycolate lyase [Sphingobium phenoxybenzoativorans]